MLLDTEKIKGIGTLSEKNIHSTLKEYLKEPHHQLEVKIGSMFADIFTGDEIIEIQTRSFDKLIKKLSIFLALYPVTIVYPIVRSKELIFLDSDTGNEIRRRKSPLKGNKYQIFKELYKIKPFLNHKNLRFHIIILDSVDTRISGTNEKINSYPTNLIEEFFIDDISDFYNFLPKNIEKYFTSSDLAKALGIKLDTSQALLNVLNSLGLVSRISKKSRSYLYQIVYKL